MTVHELIAKLQEMPVDAEVQLSIERKLNHRTFTDLVPLRTVSLAEHKPDGELVDDPDRMDNPNLVLLVVPRKYKVR